MVLHPVEILFQADIFLPTAMRTTQSGRDPSLIRELGLKCNRPVNPAGFPLTSTLLTRISRAFEFNTFQ